MKYRDKEFLQEMGLKGLGDGSEYWVVEIIRREW
jgi:hypothetical protein